MSRHHFFDLMFSVNEIIRRETIKKLRLNVKDFEFGQSNYILTLYNICRWFHPRLTNVYTVFSHFMRIFGLMCSVNLHLTIHRNQHRYYCSVLSSAVHPFSIKNIFLFSVVHSQIVLIRFETKTNFNSFLRKFLMKLFNFCVTNEPDSFLPGGFFLFHSFMRPYLKWFDTSFQVFTTRFFLLLSIFFALFFCRSKNNFSNYDCSKTKCWKQVPNITPKRYEKNENGIYNN